MVIVDGEVLVEEGRLVRRDQAGILAELKRVSRALVFS
jgi:hypothetical protein